MSLFIIEFKDKLYMKKRQMVKENERVWKEIRKLYEHLTSGKKSGNCMNTRQWGILRSICGRENIMLEASC